MKTMYPELALGIVALVLLALIVADIARQGRVTIGARTRLLIVAIFVAVICWLHFRPVG